MRHFKMNAYWASIIVLVFSIMTSVAMVQRGLAEESGGQEEPPRWHHHMTKEQHQAFRTCMAGQGITLPTREQMESGERPQRTDEEKAKFRAAAKVCHERLFGKKSPSPSPSEPAGN